MTTFSVSVPPHLLFLRFFRSSRDSLLSSDVLKLSSGRSANPVSITFWRFKNTNSGIDYLTYVTSGSFSPDYYYHDYRAPIPFLSETKMCTPVAEGDIH